MIGVSILLIALVTAGVVACLYVYLNYKLRRSVLDAQQPKKRKGKK